MHKEFLSYGNLLINDILKKMELVLNHVKLAELMEQNDLKRKGIKLIKVTLVDVVEHIIKDITKDTLWDNNIKNGKTKNDYFPRKKTTGHA